MIGTYVIAVASRTVPNGTVALITNVGEPGTCVACWRVGPLVDLSGLDHIIRAKGRDGWCLCGWRPYHGPEQARRVCEEVEA